MAEQKAAKKRLQQSVPAEIDTGAGFFIEEEEDFDTGPAKKPLIIKEDNPVIGDEVECTDCGQSFSISFLRTNFDADVCDACRKNEDHKLIAKTTAKTKYLLKDDDLDLREPVLRFITKKNPRNNYWGDMKLYLESQCFDRAMEIWGSMDRIDEEVTKRKILNARAKAKKYDKKMLALKMEVRSSLYTKELSGHKHEFDDEVYDSEKDEYSKTCTSCGHTITYEKM